MEDEDTRPLAASTKQGVEEAKQVGVVTSHESIEPDGDTSDTRPLASFASTSKREVAEAEQVAALLGLLNATRTQLVSDALSHDAERAATQIGDIEAFAYQISPQLDKGQRAVRSLEPLQQLAFVLARVTGPEVAAETVESCAKLKVNRCPAQQPCYESHHALCALHPRPCSLRPMNPCSAARCCPSRVHSPAARDL
jgi:hypothetical protein